MIMLSQFFGKIFYTTFAMLVAVFLFASVLYFEAGDEVMLITLLLIGSLIFTVSFCKLEYGLLIVFAELFANSHGHLISYDIADYPAISIRMVVFAAVLAAWLLRILFKKSKLILSDYRAYPFLLLGVAVLLGFIIGFERTDAITVFQDGNAYLYLFYLLPILSIHWTDKKRKDLLQVFTASTIWVMLLSFGILYVFSHFPEWTLESTYAFLRDTRTAEITKISESIFRVFLQAQVFVMVLFLLLAGLQFKWQNFSNKVRVIIIVLQSAAVSIILLSLSRSFWLGICSGLFVLLIAVWKSKNLKIKPTLGVFGSSLLSVAVGIFFIFFIVWFPFPGSGQTGNLSGAFSSRANQGVAISSRWNLLDPMLEQIAERPLLGSGFGQTVTFKTDDPRAVAATGDGVWTTYSMEWGWLELWIKLGILGPVAFIWILFHFTQGLLPYLKTERFWIGAGFIASVFLMYATHIFSPYLNHPIGIGFLLFLIPFLMTKKQPLHAVELLKNQAASLKATTAPETSGVMSTVVEVSSLE